MIDWWTVDSLLLPTNQANFSRAPRANNREAILLLLLLAYVYSIPIQPRGYGSQDVPRVRARYNPDHTSRMKACVTYICMYTQQTRKLCHSNGFVKHKMERANTHTRTHARTHKDTHTHITNMHEQLLATSELRREMETKGTPFHAAQSAHELHGRRTRVPNKVINRNNKNTRRTSSYCRRQVRQEVK